MLKHNQTSNSLNLRWLAISAITTGLLSGCTFSTTPSFCAETTTPIHQIQGSQSLSPFVDEIHRVRGVVSANFQGDSELGGFFIQSLAEDTDDDSRT
ncbi:MAG TPA: hypothetical protein VFM61_08960, partial [Pseudidiomarina sp.]|nr:hypothetical protein [Pseudidiomarina sp.]